MTNALHMTIKWENVEMELCDDSLAAYESLQKDWNEKWASVYAPLLRRWLKMQLALALFPYAGLGDSLSERITIIGVRLATLRIAILCSCGMNETTLASDDAVRVVQTVSRVLDHLGDSRFSLNIYGEPNWLEEARMLGLLNI
ncbi:MAG: hypothetical protein EBR02_03285 [Alphaproteobacteria bacterium]|nr:hypothetical protein [Alphaproteobacteria bacterium]